MTIEHGTYLHCLQLMPLCPSINPATVCVNRVRRENRGAGGAASSRDDIFCFISSSCCISAVILLCYCCTLKFLFTDMSLYGKW